MSETDQATWDRLSRLSGAEFDKAYADAANSLGCLLAAAHQTVRASASLAVSIHRLRPTASESNCDLNSTGMVGSDG
jgi:hypothetical protein